MKTSRRFWIFYTLAWLLYAASLMGVFIEVGFPIEAGLLIQVFANVAPAFLLGIGVVYLCRKLFWKNRKTPSFILAHAISLALFPVLWTFLTLFDFTILNFLKSGVWNFVTWDKYALQWQFISGLMAYVTMASAVYVGEANDNLQTEIRRSAELEIRAARAEAARNQAELVALRAQLNPHFLFNTLHSLMALVRQDARRAEEAIERFALMLRYVLQAQSENRADKIDVAFADEWRFVENYLELERLRLGDRLRIETDIELAAMDFKMPAFTVQPLVENSIKHAIAPNKNGGALSVSAKVSGGVLNLEIADDGNGANAAEIENSNGLGLRLVRESLQARFGGAAVFDYQTAPGGGFKVLIKIPKNFDAGENQR